MKNKLSDLNNHLFAQLELLNDEGISAEDLDKEIKRAEAIAKVSTQIIDSSNLSLRAASLVAEYGGSLDQMTSMIEGASSAQADRMKLIQGKVK